MDNVFGLVKGFFSGMSDVLMSMFGLAVLAEILFGGVVFGMDVISNISGVVTELGNGGFVGLVTLIVLFSLFNKE